MTLRNEFQLRAGLGDDLSYSNGSRMVDINTVAAAITNQKCRLLGVKSVGVDFGLVRTGW